MLLNKPRVALVFFALLGTVGGPFHVSARGNSRHSHYQAKNMFVFGDPSTLVAGAATLTRTADGISYQVYTSGLTPGSNTVWIVIFNKPEHCAGGPGACMASDLGSPAVQGSVVAGSGYLVGNDGLANFVGSLDKGNPPAGIQVNVPNGTVNGLKNPMKAEIHLVLREHGTVDAFGEAVDQLTTFEDAAVCASRGRVCANVQAAVFERLHGGSEDEDD